jgi:dTDP-4-amino-4,6-dideoxygalactose transaminase
MTFAATAEVVRYQGAIPVLVDCEPDSRNLDPRQLDAAIGPRTRAILPVHFAGRPADMPAILKIAARHELVVIEDACQAHGASLGAKRCGAWGRAGCFSFYPAKNLGAFGDGGLVTTNDAGLAERLRRMRNYGQATKYEHVELGGNSRLDTLQAAVLGVKLRRLDTWNAARAGHAAQYRERLAGVGDLQLPAISRCDETNVFHLFMIETDHRDALQAHLAAAGVQTGIHYPTPIHLQRCYATLGYSRGAFPVAERLARRILSIPMFPELTGDEIEYVAACIREFFR